MYVYDGNEILAGPIKNRPEATIRDAFIKMHKILQSRVSDPKFYMVDNECSSHLKEAMKNIPLTSNLPHHKCTVEMQRKGPLELSRII